MLGLALMLIHVLYVMICHINECDLYNADAVNVINERKPGGNAFA